MSNDNASPATLDSPLVKKNKYQRDIEQARLEGERDGRKQGHTDLIDWLQERYMAADAPARGSVEANAILKLAREASEHFAALDSRAAKKRRRS